jgi:osmotically inducible protein OsmC
MAVRTSAAQWHGRVQDGRGSVSLGSGAFEGPYSFWSRFEEEAGTNPEELLGAAHASCFSMALSLLLTKAGFTPSQIETRARVHIDPVDEGYAITRIELATQAQVPGLDQTDFAVFAQSAKRDCPVSKALAGVDITLTATLRDGKPGNLSRASASHDAPRSRQRFMSRRGSEAFRRVR